MVRLKFQVEIPKNLTPKMSSTIKNTAQKSVRTVAQDLARTASETTPHLTGDLSGSYAIGYKMSGETKEATVEFSAYNKGFNYAVAMHEWTYKLGEGSRAKGGGTGMSGKTYAVGRKFLTRVFEGESKAYKEYIQQQIKSSLGV